MKFLDYSASHYDCNFFCDDSEVLFYKHCKNPRAYHSFETGFYREFLYMKSLNLSFPGSSYFPRYYSRGTFRHDHGPFICMEYIHGKSLDSILADSDACRNFSIYQTFKPQFLLPLNALVHICQQVYEALCILNHVGIIYLDLSPENIIVINDNYDIKLVDFTFCYYSKLSQEENKKIGYKTIDFQLEEDLPISLMLHKAMMLFCTRLFFPGKDAYKKYFHPDTIPEFFRPHFGALFENLFTFNSKDYNLLLSEAETIENQRDCNLMYFTRWFEEFLSYLSNK